jgi:hypothetical protein
VALLFDARLWQDPFAALDDFELKESARVRFEAESKRDELALRDEKGIKPVSAGNQIRPFSQGRRAWLFAQTQQGARASANLYSLVSCARVNGLEPYAYLRPLFEELPKAITAEALEALLPWNVKPVLQAHSAAVGACTAAFDKQKPACAIGTKMLA